MYRTVNFAAVRQAVARLAFLFVVISWVPLSMAQDPVAGALSRQLQLWENDPALKHASWGFMLIDATGNRVIASHNSDMLLVPASTQKLITTATALMLMGSDYQYKTTLEHDGHIDGNGVLHGNLYIRGSGDPSLGAARFDDTLSVGHLFGHWLTGVRNAGISRITGHIVADERIFDQEMVPRRWLWTHMGNYFGAGASGLSVNENEYTVFFNAGGAPGQPASVVKTEPYIPGMVLLNEVSTGPAGSGDQVYIFGAPYAQDRQLTGTVPLGAADFPVRGSMPDPPLFMAEAFRDFLTRHNIIVQGPGSSYRRLESDGVIASEHRETLSSWHSPWLFDIIYRTNMASVNVYAENLLRSIGHHVSGQGSLDAGLQAINAHWEASLSPGPPLRMMDGSGLSPCNRISARQLAMIMNTAAQHPAFGIIVSSLPLAGYSGSLANHFRGTKSEGRLRAKSGFLQNTIAYAGYTPMQNGNLAAFVIIVNDYEGRPATMRSKMISLMDSITLHDGEALEQEK